MKTILTSSILAGLLALSVSGCGSSSTTKKVYLNGNESNATSSNHQVGETSTDSGSREESTQTQTDNSNKNIERLAIRLSQTDAQNIHLSNDDTDFKATSISGTGKDSFMILSDGDVYPKNDIANGEYNIIIHAKAVGSTKSVEKELIVEVTGSEFESSTTTTPPATETNTTTPPATVVSGFTTVTEKPGNGDGRWSWSEADMECKNMGMRLPTIAEIEANSTDVLTAASGVDSDGDSKNGILFASVIWSSSAATKDAMGNDRRWGYNYSSNPTESGAFDINEKYYFTCVPK